MHIYIYRYVLGLDSPPLLKPPTPLWEWVWVGQETVQGLAHTACSKQPLGCTVWVIGSKQTLACDSGSAVDGSEAADSESHLAIRCSPITHETPFLVRTE